MDDTFFPWISFEKRIRTEDAASKSTGRTLAPLGHVVFFFKNNFEMSFLLRDEIEVEG